MSNYKNINNRLIDPEIKPEITPLTTSCCTVVKPFIPKNIYQAFLIYPL